MKENADCRVQLRIGNTFMCSDVNVKQISEGTLEINLLSFALMFAAGLQQHTDDDRQSSEV